MPPTKPRLKKTLLPSRLKRKPDLIGALLADLSAYLDADALAQIRAACEFSANAHRGQTRASGEDYIHHPLAVARNLGAMRMDSCTIIAAVLHDVVEDTVISLNELAEKFGGEVAALVDGVSKVSQLEQESDKQTHRHTDTTTHNEGATFRKMFMATAKDIRVIIVKLADRLHNIRTLDALSHSKQRRIAKQTLEIYAPIANRLGMRDLAHNLEELSLRNLYPKRYAAITKQINAKKRGRKSVVKETLREVKRILRRASITAEVQGREKDIYSIYCKMREKHLTLKQVQDINAIRIITDTREQCYQALGLVHQLYKPRPDSFKDYIAIPKINGYQSLHTILVGPFGQPVEVQIRSREMHRIAEQGIASHWLYKTAQSEHSPHQLAQKWLSDFLESQPAGADSAEFLDHLKADLFPDEVYVFTPRGDIRKLPRRACALDFSYAVHTDVGNRSIGAVINGRAAPLHQILHNGDHIEIKTSRKARPHPAWLDYAITSKARAAVREYLAHQQERESIQLGRKLLKQSLYKLGYRRLRIASEHKVKLLQLLHMEDWNKLLRDIGFGNRPPILVAQQLCNAAGIASSPTTDKTAAMTIAGTERLQITYSNCCHPIRGDQIIGTMTRRGLVVHRIGCANCKPLQRHLDNYFHLAWADSERGRFKVLLKLETRNQPGALAQVSRIIAAHDSNINNLQLDEPHQHTSAMECIIEVASRTHLAAIMRDLHAQKIVINLARV